MAIGRGVLECGGEVDPHPRAERMTSRPIELPERAGENSDIFALFLRTVDQWNQHLYTPQFYLNRQDEQYIAGGNSSIAFRRAT